MEMFLNNYESAELAFGVEKHVGALLEVMSSISADYVSSQWQSVWEYRAACCGVCDGITSGENERKMSSRPDNASH